MTYKKMTAWFTIAASSSSWLNRPRSRQHPRRRRRPRNRPGRRSRDWSRSPPLFLPDCSGWCFAGRYIQPYLLPARGRITHAGPPV